MNSDFPHSDSPAARMLAEGLDRAKEARGLSLRQIGKQMNYKSSVVLSHMASGRVPIPIDRVAELAHILELDEKSFLQAVVRHRHPDAPWHLLSGSGSSPGSNNLAQELEAALGGRLTDLTGDQRAVMREVAAERLPRRRWLSVHELHAVEILRDLFPLMRAKGVPQEQLDALQALCAKK